jgi:hypothetical protein
MPSFWLPGQPHDESLVSVALLPEEQSGATVLLFSCGNGDAWHSFMAGKAERLIDD